MHQDAAAFAAARIAAVRDDPAGRLALASSIYDDATGRRSQRPRFRRAALAFTRWMAERGVLNALGGSRPGSSWWRAMNDRLLRDSCEAFGRATGRPGSPSTDTVDHWTAFIDQPTAQTWYRAHNASIVAAYLDHRALAVDENRVERFFLNVVLARVLYAHALVAAPRLALGRTARFGPSLGDPRRGTVDLFLAMGRVLPDAYPADGELEDYLQLEHKLGRVLDYAVIIPRLRPLYDWSARELDRPELSESPRRRRSRIRLAAGRSTSMEAAATGHHRESAQDTHRPPLERTNVRKLRRQRPWPRAAVMPQEAPLGRARFSWSVHGRK